MPRNDPNKVLRVSGTTATVNARDYKMVLADATSNAIALALVSPGAFSEWQIKIRNTGTVNDVTITVLGGGTINGGSSVVLPLASAVIIEQDDLGNLHVFGGTGGGSNTPAGNTLLLASNVVEAETVTIGADVYEYEVVNTDTTDNTAGGDFNNVTNPVTVLAATYPNTTLTAGKLIRIQSEILRVTGVVTGTVTLARGQSNTTAATHANGQDIFQGDGIVAGFAVGVVATLTPTVAAPALAAVINAQGTEAFTATSTTSSVAITATSNGASHNGVVCTETLTGSGNVWVLGQTFGGTSTGF